MDGQLTFEFEPGVGSRFFFTLPLPSAMEEVSPPAASVKKSVTHLTEGYHVQALVASDKNKSVEPQILLEALRQNGWQRLRLRLRLLNINGLASSAINTTQVFDKSYYTFVEYFNPKSQATTGFRLMCYSYTYNILGESEKNRCRRGLCW